jgi:hypothetical protein
MKTFKGFLLTSAFVLATVLLCSRVTFAQSNSPTASSDVPRTLSYQGLMQSSDGTAINGAQPMTIRLYSDTAGQNLVWEDNFTPNIQNGLFNVMLGSQKPLPTGAQMSTPLWVAVKLGAAEEMKPYAALSSSPYALTVADGAITADKMGTDYVGSIYVNGTKISSKGTGINLQAGSGLALSYDPISSSIWLSAAGSGTGSPGGGGEPQANRVWTFNGRTQNVVSVAGDYDFSQLSGNVDLTSQVANTLPVANGGIGVTTATANKVFAGPANGGASAPAFRSLVANDIPTLNQNTTGTASNVTGIVAKANGGTGVTNASGIAQSAFFGGPSSGGAGAASYRALVASDIPTLNQNTTGTASNVTGTVALANGGTGLSGSGASGNYLRSNGATWASSAIQVSDVPTLNQNTTGTSANVTGTVAVAHGGTGVSTASANEIFAGPTSGGAAAPSFRALVAADIPTLNQNTTGTATNVTGTVAVANGGTGVAASGNAGNYLRSNGASWASSAIQAGDVPTLNQNTTGTASNVTGIVAKANGGTGVTNASGVAQSTFFGGPSAGAGAASYRVLVAADIPTLNQNTTGTATNVTGTVAVANGGTGVAASGNAGNYLRSNGASWASSAIQAGDVPTLNQNTTGTASNVTGIVAKANGGTGVTNASGVAQSAFFGGPSAGAGAASYRALVAGDIPTLNQNTTGTAANVTGIVAKANGGTGVTNASGVAQSAFFAGPSSGGAGAGSYRAIVATDLPTLNQNTTGTASNVTGTVAIANGGTGASSFAAAGLVTTTTLNNATLPASVTTLTASGAATLSSTASIGGALNMNSHLIDNVTDPVSAQDVATKNYVDTHIGGVEYINNSTTTQDSANFNVDGSGQVGTTLTAGGNFNTTGGAYQIAGTTILANPGTGNLFTGGGAGANITSGYYNTFSGIIAGAATQDGIENTFVGAGSGYNNTSGGTNTFVGAKVGFSNTTAIDNTFNGAMAGYNNTTGSENTFLGANAGPTNLTGTNLSLLGSGADVGSDGLTDATAIGSGAVVNASYTIQLGDASVTSVKTSGSLTAGGSIITGGHLVATSSATAAASNGGVTISDVPVFVITSGASATFALTMPASPATGDIIVVINQDSHNGTYSTTAVVPPLGSRTFYYNGSNWQ